MNIKSYITDNFHNYTFNSFIVFKRQKYKTINLCLWVHNKDIICNINNKKWPRVRSVGIDFCMWLKLSWYQFKIDCYNFRIFYVTSMLTTKKISVEYTQKEMKGNQNVSLQKIN